MQRRLLKVEESYHIVIAVFTAVNTLDNIYHLY